VVGDITILADRAQFVDFTLPYTELGVRMLVPVVRGRHQTMWIFVRPFSWDLWLSILLINMLIGVVILITERNIHIVPHHNQSSPRQQQLSALTILWFPISQAILPESNFSKVEWLYFSIQ
jgi:hypothetical protein